MKKIILGILILLLSKNIYSQEGWVKILNAGSGLTSIHFLNANTGIVCGQNGALLKTTNGGLNWVQLNSSFTGIISDVVMLSSQIILASSGDNEKIIRSTDGGINWLQIISGSPAYRIANFSFPNDSIGYAIADAGNYILRTNIYKTTNRGATWSAALSLCCGKSIQFINSQTGWVCGTSNSIGLSLYAAKTTSGGASWIPGYGISMANEIDNKMFIKNESEIFWSWIGENKVYKSYNSIVDWTSVHIPSSPQINSIKFINNATGWAVGSQGTIAKTTDGGSNWISHSNASFSFKKIIFVDNITGWLISDFGDVFKTTNGGLTIVNPATGTIPDKYLLHQNYPNPFNPSTRINYEIRNTNYVSLKVFDLLGKEIASLVNEKQSAGSYAVDFNSAEFNLPSGIYFYTLNAGEFTETKKMVLVK